MMNLSAAECAQTIIAPKHVASWFYIPQRRPNARLRLFCFPYAGGSPALFRTWLAGLPVEVELCAVTLPGRGARARELPCTDLFALSRELADVVTDLHDRPFGFFGHSMGALLAFEVTRCLRAAGSPLPVQLILSARQAPDVHSPPTAPLGELDDEQFVDRLAQLGGTPAAVLAQRDLMLLLAPLLRADFVALERWRYRVEPPLPVSILALAGRCDHSVSVDAVAAWRRQSHGDFRLRVLEGGHFFIHEQEAAVTSCVAEALAAYTVAG